MSNKCFLVFLAFLFSVSVYSQQGRHRSSLISGRVMSTEKEVVDFATVYLKGTNQGCYTDEKGIYHLKTTAGEYTLVVSAIGYQTVEKKVKLAKGERIKVNVTIAPAVKELGEVLVTTSGVGRVNQSAFNAVAIDAKKLHNSTQTLAGALTKVPGVKLRESGGVGSDMQLYIDGFSGKHVKIFIDGIPQEGAGAAFDLNNVPINFADRIEVYKGVVPVGFGTDAIGGVVNIVTNKQPGKWFMDASYSYGSFNTHKSYVRFGQTFKNGFMYEVNAFQNFSDNDYYVDTYVREFEIKEDGSVHKPLSGLLVGDNINHSPNSIGSESYRNYSFIDFYTVGKINRNIVQIECGTGSLLWYAVNEDFHMFPAKAIDIQLHIRPHST